MHADAITAPEAVLGSTLPNLMADDSLNMATTLCFQVNDAS